MKVKKEFDIVRMIESIEKLEKVCQVGECEHEHDEGRVGIPPPQYPIGIPNHNPNSNMDTEGIMLVGEDKLPKFISEVGIGA